MKKLREGFFLVETYKVILIFIQKHKSLRKAMSIFREQNKVENLILSIINICYKFAINKIVLYLCKNRQIDKSNQGIQKQAHADMDSWFMKEVVL